MAWRSAMNSPGFEYAFSGTEYFSNASLILMTSSRRKKKHRAGKFRSGPFGSGGSDCGEGEVLQTERPLRLGPRYVAREFRVASSNPLVQRFPSNPALGAAPSPAHVQKYGVDLALTGKIPDPCAG